MYSGSVIEISGPSLVCTSGANFTLNNAPTGAAVTWAVSHPQFFRHGSGSGTGTQANLVVLQNAYDSNSEWISITFSIEGPCGAIEISKELWFGHPIIDYNPGIVDPHTGAPCTKNPYFYATPLSPDLDYSWSVSHPSVWLDYYNFPSATIFSMNPVFFDITVDISDDFCAISSTLENQYDPGYYCMCFEDPNCESQMGGMFELLVYPNPANSEISFLIVIPENEVTESDISPYEAIFPITYNFYDKSGLEVMQITTE